MRLKQTLDHCLRTFIENGIIRQTTGVHMMQMSLKKTLILTLSILSFSTSAHNLVDKDLLVKQCRDLSETIGLLVSSQGKKSCVEKLGSASVQIEDAGDFIINNDNVSARQELDSAIYSLQYAELNNCNRYMQISHSKFEAQRIKSYL